MSPYPNTKVPGSIPNIISDLAFNAVILRCVTKQKYKNNSQKRDRLFAAVVYGLFFVSANSASASFAGIDATTVRYPIAKSLGVFGGRAGIDGV